MSPYTHSRRGLITLFSGWVGLGLMLGTGLPATATPAAAASNPLVVDLAGLAEGARVSGRANIEARTSGDVSAVFFQLSGARSAQHTERIAPYYFMGDDQGIPRGWDTRGWPNGTYTMMATACNSSGTCNSLRRSFTIANSSTQPAPTPQPSPVTPPAASALWSADHETGNLAQWQAGQYGQAVFNSGTGAVAISDAVARSGRYSVALSIRDASGTTQGARLFRWHETDHEGLKEGYFSAWYYFPQRYKPGQWWNILQFKSKTGTRNDPMWVLDVDDRTNGEMYLTLSDWQNRRRHEQSQLNLPVGRWVHIEVYYRRSTTNTGQITVWQDGTKLWDLNNVRTALDDNFQWSVNNYTNQISPDDSTIYVDDAVISTTRVGPR